MVEVELQIGKRFRIELGINLRLGFKTGIRVRI